MTPGLLLVALAALARPDPGASDDLAKIEATFKSAPGDFGPVPIWWWSGDKLEVERLFWELDRMMATMQPATTASSSS